MMLNFVNLKNIEEVLQLEVRQWRNDRAVTKFFQIIEIDQETHLKWLKSLQEDNPKNIAFVIQEGGNNIGLVYFSKINYERQDSDWGMYIKDENYRGKGIGTEVMNWSFNYLSQIGIKTLNLEVLKNNPIAINLYEKMGFVYVGDKNKKVSCYRKLLNG